MPFGFGVGIQRLGSFGVGTRAELLALTPAAGTRPTGFVYADSTVAYNGVYAWSGSAWSRKRGLPDSIATATSIAGTANAITGSLPAYVDPAYVALVLLTPASSNTGAVTYNGIPVNDAAGSALVTGSLVAGRTYLLENRGTSYRVLLTSLSLISDVSGLQAALDAKASITYVDGLISALKGGVSTAFDTLAELADAITALASKWDAAVIHALASKATPVDADELGIIDSGASNTGKKLLLSSLRAWLEGWFSGPIGQCRLVKSGANIVLQPFGGDKIKIAGKLYPIPTGGVTLTPTGLAVGSDLNVYVLQTAGVLSLEAVATGHATDTTAGNVGVEIKTGDATRTLVGKVRCIAGPAFQDTNQQRFVISWFNRIPKVASATRTLNDATSSNSYAELTALLRNEWLSWGDATLHALSATVFNNTIGGVTYLGPAIDGVTSSQVMVSVGNSAAANGSYMNSSLVTMSLPVEGYHFTTVLAAASTGSTATLASAAAGGTANTTRFVG